MADDPKPAAVPGYKLTESDKSMIRGISNPRSNIAAVHFDGQVLCDMEAVERLNPRLPDGFRGW